jgi:predicted DNA binding protein
MWVAKLRIKHDDCVVGTRCRRFNVVSAGIPLSSYADKDFQYFSHFETLSGKEEDIAKFVDDLKKDKQIMDLEMSGDSIFFLVKIPKKNKIPTTHYDPKIFWLKPVVVDEQGYEWWEIGTWDRTLLNKFIHALESGNYDLKILKIKNEMLNEIHFPQVMPFLTKSQKKALELAYRYGYYDFPRKTELRDLAKKSGLSLSTFREHLRKAEKRIIPNLMRNLKN